MQLFVATLNFTVVRKIVNLAVSFVLKNTFGNRPKKFDFVHQTGSYTHGLHTREGLTMLCSCHYSVNHMFTLMSERK